MNFKKIIKMTKEKIAKLNNYWDNYIKDIFITEDKCFNQIWFNKGHITIIGKTYPSPAFKYWKEFKTLELGYFHYVSIKEKFHLNKKQIIDFWKKKMFDTYNLKVKEIYGFTLEN